MTMLFLYAFVAIGFSFFCSVAEAVLLSVSPSYIAQLRTSGSPAAELLEKLKAQVDRPLAAILSLNTIAHTVGAAGVGAEASNIWGSQAVGWASAIMTLLILVLSEIIPKTIGAVYWRQLAPWIARSLRVLIWVLYPLVWMSELMTKLISGGKAPEVVTRDEVAAMASLSSQAGELDASESRILENLFRLKDLTVRDIMTPRTVIIAFSEAATVGDVREKYPRLPVSRVPVFSENIDSVTGFVLRSDVLQADAEDKPETTLLSIRRDIRVISSDDTLMTLFDLLMHQRAHIAIVRDSYGGTDGIVTMEDLLETLLGLEIVDEHDRAIDMQRLAREKWRERAHALGLDVEAAIGTRDEGESPMGSTSEEKTESLPTDLPGDDKQDA